MEDKIFYYVNQVESIRSRIYVPPVSCEIDPSNGCMLECNFCMFKKQREGRIGENLPFEVFLRLAQDLSQAGCRSITFTGGGEPLINKDINDMLSAAISLGFECGLVTNGVLLHDLLHPEKFKFIRVSLNAATNKTYEKITGKPYFERVLWEMQEVMKKGAFVGWSFVVSEDNVDEVNVASQIAEEIGVKYIQFKPAYISGRLFDMKKVEGKIAINTPRYKQTSNLPCQIAHLVGVVCADAKVYYCCQHRLEEKYCLGSLKDQSFTEIWMKRFNYFVNWSDCPYCRYTSYSKRYEEFINGNDLFFSHRYFL